jgi:CubicO group peptidase (beta-lactamase class C family)/septal ring factor EnvC (AmiA/AmiB activator)
LVWLSAVAQSPTSASSSPVEGALSWPTEPAAEHATRPARLAEAVARIGAMPGIYSLLVAHRGALVVERYFRDGFREKPHNLKSASKSVLSALVGIAVAEGLLDLDRPIVEILPGSIQLDDPRKATITVRHLLTMTSGLESTSYETYGEWTAGSDWIRGALALALVAEPGSQFQYSTGNTHLLSAVLTAATGMSTREYAESRLFGPLGVRIKGWARDPNGVHIGGNDLSLTPREMARFGQLFLDGGHLGGSQIVPADWVATSTRTGEIGRHDTYGTYGYLWWTDLVYEGAFIAVGFGGQYVYVSPPHDLVVVVTSTLISKGEEWTDDLFEELRHGVLASFAPSADFYARSGRPPADPAIESLERAVARAQTELAALKVAADADPPAVPGRGWTVARVNLRRNRDTGSERIRLLERGIAVELLDQADGWLQARVDGEEGWIRADFVRIENGSWRPLATALRQDLAAFSEAIRGRLAVRPAEPVAPTAPLSPAAVEGAQVADLEERLAASNRDRMRLQSRLAELDRKVADQEERLSGAGAASVELQEAQARIESLANQLAASADGDRTATAELADARLRIAGLEDEVADSAAERGSLADRLSAAQDDADSQAGALAAAEQSRLAQARELTVAGDRITYLERELIATDARGQELAAELDQQRALVARVETEAADNSDRMAAELATARAGISGFEASLMASENARRDLERDLAASRVANSALAERLETTAAARSYLEADLAALEIAQTRLEQNLVLSQAGKTALEESFVVSRATQSELEARLARLNGEKARLEVGLTQASESCQSVIAELELARGRVVDLERELESARTLGGELELARGRVVDLERELESARTLGGELELARGRVVDLQRDLESARMLRGELELAQGRVVDLERELESFRALRGELDISRGRIAALEGQLDDAGEERRLLEMQLADEEAETTRRFSLDAKAQGEAADQLRQAHTRIVALEASLTTARARALDLEARIEDLSTSEDEKSAQLAHSTQAQQDLAAELASTRQRIRDLEQVAVKDGEFPAVLESRLAAQQLDAAALAAALEKAQSGQATLLSRLRMAEERSINLEDLLRAARNDRSRLVAEVRDLGARGGGPSAAAAVLGTDLRSADARIRVLESQLRAAEDTNLRLHDSLKGLRAEWEERTLELAKATRVRQALTRRLAAASRQIAEIEAQLERGAAERAVLADQLAAAEQRAIE